MCLKTCIKLKGTQKYSRTETKRTFPDAQEGIQQEGHKCLKALQAADPSRGHLR